MIPPNTSPEHDVRLRIRNLAEKSLEATYIAVCPRHGETIFDTASNGCLTCISANTDLPPRIQYLAAGSFLYPKNCTACGVERMHHFHSNKCNRCYDSAGRTRRRDTDHARGTARQMGFRKYADNCKRHGKTDFWTVAGKCALCFTSAGVQRSRDSKAQTPERVEARKARAQSYIGSCFTHGRTAFGVRYGKCLSCYTTDGWPRRIPLTPGV